MYEQRPMNQRKKVSKPGTQGLLIALLVVGLNCGPVISAEVQPANTVGPEQEDSSGDFIPDVFSFRYGCFRPQVNLNGEWEFTIDKEGVGTTQGWHEGRGVFDRTIKIPGVPQAQGIGSPNLRQRNQFLDPFWVRRKFQMPRITSGQRVWLRLGGVLPAAAVYLNGAYVGYTKSSRTQQRVDVTEFVKPGVENLVAIKVCDFPKVRLDGMYEWQELSMIWSGVYRPVCLEITDQVSLIDEYIQPRLAQSKTEVSFRLSHPAPSPLRVVLRAMDGKRVVGSAEVTLPAGNTEGNAEVKLGKFITWYPTHPKLYTMETLIYREGGKQPIDKSGLRFGMREISYHHEQVHPERQADLRALHGRHGPLPRHDCSAGGHQLVSTQAQARARLWDQHGQSLRGNVVAGLRRSGG